MEVALQPLVTDDAQFVISSILDVSKRKAAEREIRQKNENLTQLNEDLSAFAYSASHDLKAPLATIRGLSQCILEDLEANRLGEVRTNIGRIEVLTERLSTLVEDVLSVARSEAQGESGTFRVDEQIRLSVAKHSELQSRHGVEVDLSAVGSIELESELVRFTSIIDNLISNAFRYSDPDKAHRVVEVSAECIDDALHVEVRDNGLGIPKEMHERIFRMFERAHARVPDGSGLGLALARKHAERLGGEISLKIRDEWTIFSVRIPMSIASHLKEAGDPK